MHQVLRRLNSSVPSKSLCVREAIRVMKTVTTCTTSTVLSESQSKSPLQKCCDLSLWKLQSATSSSDKNESGEIADITVDIIVPVHNASSTIRETIASAMNQIWLIDKSSSSSSSSSQPNIAIHVCCYNDASTDDSWLVLKELYDIYSTGQPQCSVVTQPFTLNGESRNTDTDCTIDKSIVSHAIPTQLWISTSGPDSTARGPGYARNRAVQMRDTMIASQYEISTVVPMEQHFICWLDSDDIMHPTRIYYQVHSMMQLQPEIRLKTLLGTNFDRFITTGLSNDKNSNPPGEDSITNTITPHYTKWANDLSQERLYLERFREVTIIQPTWMMCRHRYTRVLCGYLECPPVVVRPHPNHADNDDHVENVIAIPIGTSLSSSSSSNIQHDEQTFSEWIRNVSSSHGPMDNDFGVTPWRLVHTEIETSTTIRVAEDLRFFHEHFYNGGLVQRTTASSTPLVAYRHRPGISQSALTSRKLLLALRVVAFEQMILFNSRSDKNDVWDDKFIIWGAGRDGKDFYKALSPQARQRVYCFVDVDDAKIARGFYNYCSPASSNETKAQQIVLNVPIVHFSLAARDPVKKSRLYNSWKVNTVSEDIAVLPYSECYGRIVKNQESSMGGDTSTTMIQSPKSKRMKVSPNKIEKTDPGMKSLDASLLPNLPVVVCVSMYRTNGALESNVNLIDRVEGKDLWHFS